MFSRLVARISVAAALIFVSACDDDYFDKSHYEEIIGRAFPVENVAREHRWTIVDSASAEPLRYCFEDNFPQEGDYDFNDCVLTVSPTVDGRTVTLRVSLDAVGTVKQIAAAMRIRGVRADDVVPVAVEGDFDTDRPQASFRIIDTDAVLLPPSHRRTDDLVVRLFNDAHWSIGRTLERDGSVRRHMYNTVGTSATDSRIPHSTVRPAVAVYTLRCSTETVAAAFVAGNMDVFIIENFNGTYMEVHTRMFKTDEVIYHYIASPSDYDDPYIWALQLPAEFLYPTEGMAIGTGRNGVFSGAYHTPGHSFAEWAADPVRATDWWQYPSKQMVYPSGRNR